MEEELLASLGPDTKVVLIAGSGGVFEVTADARKIFSKQQLGRFPDEGEIVGLIKG